MSRPNRALPSPLLLHAGGWDELIMVAVGLVLAWVVISTTGRRAPDSAEEDAEAAQSAEQEEDAEAAEEEMKGRPT